MRTAVPATPLPPTRYRDTQTLKKRLQDLAKTMGIRASGGSGGSGAKPQAQNVPVGGTGGANGAVHGGIGGGKGGAGGGSQNNDQRQQVLRQQQQRLLLLRHASKCKHENGKCPVTQHCAGMKRLWKHIAECKDQLCQVPHCVSSRYVLSHYHRCKEAGCAVCGPVREAIHRNHEKVWRSHYGVHIPFRYSSPSAPRLYVGGCSYDAIWLLLTVATNPTDPGPATGTTQGCTAEPQ